MQHWQHLAQHWQDITVYLMAGGALPDWAKIVAPVILAAISGGIVAIIVTQERVKHIEERILAHDSKLEKGILPVAEERQKNMQLELLQMQRENDVLMQRVSVIESNGPTYCLRCHMRQGFDHPSTKGLK